MKSNYFFSLDCILTIHLDRKVHPDDFDYLANLGAGQFGSVSLVREREDHKIYALKILKNLSSKEIKAIYEF